MLELLGHYIIRLIESTNYFGIFILMTLESALLPIPSEVTMPFSGFLVAQGKLLFWPVVLTGTFANLVGSLIAYYIGFILEETVLLRLIRKYGKFILVSVEDYEHANIWVKKYGNKIILISRVLPAVRTFISLPAGVFKMDLKQFIAYTTIGCFIWSAILTYIGVVLGKNWSSIDVYFRQFQLVIVLLFVLLVAVYLERKLKLRKKIFKPKS